MPLKRAKRRATPATAAREDAGDEAACAVCGCTAERACPGGCYWVDSGEAMVDLCSQCVGKPLSGAELPGAPSRKGRS